MTEERTRACSDPNSRIINKAAAYVCLDKRSVGYQQNVVHKKPRRYFFKIENVNPEIERSDFLGIADKSQLLIWAANRLELLEKPSMKIRVFQLKEASPLTFMNFEESSLSAAHRIRSSVPSVKTMVFLLAFRLSISLSNIPILIYLQI